MFKRKVSIQALLAAAGATATVAMAGGTYGYFSSHDLPAYAASAGERKIAADDGAKSESFLKEFEAVPNLPLVKLKKVSVLIEWARTKPHALFEELRAKRPILEAPPIPMKKSGFANKGTYVISNRKDVIEVLDNPTIFSVRPYKSKFEPSLGSFMLDQDGTRYNSVEKPWMRKMLKPSDLPKLKKLIDALAEKAVEEGKYVGKDMRGKYFGRLEVVNQIARRVPILLTGAYFGMPGPNEETMFRWSRATQEDYFHNPTNKEVIHQAGIKAGQEMHVYMKQLIAERRKQLESNPDKDDVLSRLLKDKDAAKDLNDDRIATNIMGTLIGGVETTEAAISQALEELLKRPEQLAKAREAAEKDDMELLGKYIWEALRFQPVFPFVMRYAEQDFVLGKGTAYETKIPKGSIVLASSMSAMFDEAYVKDAKEFRIDRPGYDMRDPKSWKTSVYLHLGYEYHRCLGDYVSLVQVPVIIKHLLLKKNLRPADGFTGQITKEGPVGREDDRAFPERFAVEWDEVAPPADKVQIAHKDYAFEDYLMDFNRKDFFQCVTEKEYGLLMLPVSVYTHFASTEKKGLFWCRLNAEFRGCVLKRSRNLLSSFKINEGSERHREAMMACQQETGKLTKTEWAFYHPIMLNRPMPIPMEKVPTVQAKRGDKGYEYEDYIKFYSRYDFRDCFRNPAGLASFTDEQWFFYARLPWQFRICMGVPVLAHKLTFGKVGHDRAGQYQICKKGKYMESAGKYEGALSLEERYFFHKIMLGEKDVTLEQVERE